MTLPRYALDYNTCTYKEKRAFIKARTRPENAKEIKQKIRAIGRVRVLQFLDKIVTFRFMDLIPELRLMIYEHLLTKDGQTNSRAHPALLLTCKKIHAEATPILYSRSNADITIHLFNTVTHNGQTFHKPGVKVYIGSQLVFAGGLLAPNPKLATSLLSLKRLQILHLDVTFVGFWRAHDRGCGCLFHALEICLEDLVDACGELRRLSLRVRDEKHEALDLTRTKDEAMGTIEASLRTSVVETLVPLIRLPEVCVLDLEGVDDQTYEAFWERVTDQPRRDKEALEKAKQLLKEKKMESYRKEWPALPPARARSGTI